MNLQDLREQVEGRWYLVPITYITVGDALPTKIDQNEFDQIKQLVYFIDDNGEKEEMAVYGIEPIKPKKGRIVYKIKHKDGVYVGHPTDKVPSPLKPITKASAWDIKAEKIAYGKTKCKIVEAAIISNQIECKTREDVLRWAEVIFEPRQELEQERN